MVSPSRWQERAKQPIAKTLYFYMYLYLRVGEAQGMMTRELCSMSQVAMRLIVSLKRYIRREKDASKTLQGLQRRAMQRKKTCALSELVAKI